LLIAVSTASVQGFIGQSAYLGASAQTTTERTLTTHFIPEPGCPIHMDSVQTILDIDPFGAPASSRIYITYRNISTQPIIAVKFRCRYTDAKGLSKGTFHAPDAYQVAPGESRTQKWKRDGELKPDIQTFAIRTYQVKFVDGSEWQSPKLKDLANLNKKTESDDVDNDQDLNWDETPFVQGVPSDQQGTIPPPQSFAPSTTNVGGPINSAPPVSAPMGAPINTPMGAPMNSAPMGTPINSAPVSNPPTNNAWTAPPPANIPSSQVSTPASNAWTAPPPANIPSSQVSTPASNAWTAPPPPSMPTSAPSTTPSSSGQLPWHE
jgi:hypothetical protein